MIAVQFAHTDSCTKHSGYIEVFYFERELVFDHFNINASNVSYFAYACKTEGKNDISRLISETA